MKTQAYLFKTSFGSYWLRIRTNYSDPDPAKRFGSFRIRVQLGSGFTTPTVRHTMPRNLLTGHLSTDTRHCFGFFVKCFKNFRGSLLNVFFTLSKPLLRSDDEKTESMTIQKAGRRRLWSEGVGNPLAQNSSTGWDSPVQQLEAKDFCLLIVQRSFLTQHTWTRRHDRLGLKQWFSEAFGLWNK